jgi:hypothetical protein
MNIRDIIRPSLILYVVSLIFLLLYTYTQVDLGLTLTRSGFLQEIQRSFQQIGYFQRPLATVLYIVLLMVFFGWYLFFLYRSHKKILTVKAAWILTILTAGVLVFSYNAFSHDLFNYIFFGKMVTVYGANPYVSKPLDFPQDPMLGFLHWTHAPYPYGPIWLIPTILLSFVGFGVFILTFFLFKVFTMLCYLVTVYYVGKIARKISPEYEALSVIFFALNPLVLTEVLISAHNDIAMMAVAMAAVYFLIARRYVFSLLLLGISIGIKYATLFLLPAFILYMLLRKRGKDDLAEKFITVAIIGMLGAVLVASLRTTFQPWYLLYMLPFLALGSHRALWFIPGVVLSLIAVWKYVPYLFLGNWNPPVPLYLLYTQLAGIVISVVFVLLWYARKHRLKKTV